MKFNKIEVKVEEYTTPNPVVAQEDMTTDDLQALMDNNNVRHLPISRAGKIVGIISDRDLRIARGLSKNEKNMVRASDIMAPEPVSVNTGDMLDEVAYTMAKNKIGSVIVLDENQELFGIFTVTDALNALIEIVRGDEI